MSVNNYISISIVVLVIGFYLYQTGVIFANFESINPKEAGELLKREKNSTVVLDVRTIEEFRSDGKIEGAILIPVQNLSAEINKLGPYRKKRILVYCRSGTRSVKASRLLVSAGFNVYNLKGGINSWKINGQKVVQ